MLESNGKIVETCCVCFVVGQVPLIIPIITAIFGCYIVVAPLVSNPAAEYLYALISFFIGFLVYIPLVYFKYSVGWIGKSSLRVYSFYFPIFIYYVLIWTSDRLNFRYFLSVSRAGNTIRSTNPQRGPNFKIYLLSRLAVKYLASSTEYPTNAVNVVPRRPSYLIIVVFVPLQSTPYDLNRK